MQARLTPALGVFLSLGFLGCSTILTTAYHRHYNSYRPPVDEVRAEVSPGLFGWIEAEKPDGEIQQPHRHVRLLVMVVGPDRLQGVECRVYLNGGRRVHFASNPEHTWTVEFPAGLGLHEITVELGRTTTEGWVVLRTEHPPLQVWQRSEG